MRPVALGPMVPINKSVFDDGIVSLETGVKMAKIKRHLSSLGMTPEQYKAKWGLPDDYPLVAKDYSQKQSDRAIDQGFGKFNRKQPELAV